MIVQRDSMESHTFMHRKQSASPHKVVSARMIALSLYSDCSDELPKCEVEKHEH